MPSRKERQGRHKHYTDGVTCPTRKRSWASRGAAKEAASRMRRMGKDRLSAYECEFCGQYHLGHLPKLVKDGELDRAELVAKPRATPQWKRPHRPDQSKP